MKKYITLIMLMGALIPAGAQAQTLSLDSCRAMALRNNKQAQCLEGSRKTWRTT